jgi:hypothetical protein
MAFMVHVDIGAGPGPGCACCVHDPLVEPLRRPRDHRRECERRVVDRGCAARRLDLACVGRRKGMTISFKSPSDTLRYSRKPKSQGLGFARARRQTPGGHNLVRNLPRRLLVERLTSGTDRGEVASSSRTACFRHPRAVQWSRLRDHCAVPAVVGRRAGEPHTIRRRRGSSVTRGLAGRPSRVMRKRPSRASIGGCSSLGTNPSAGG